MNSRLLAVMVILVGAGLLWAPQVVAQKKQAVEGPKTVIGPRNPWLAAGARAIEDGNPKRGVELTELGLANALGNYERKAALSNLCAGYLLIDEPARALDYCNRVIEMDTDFWRAYNNRALVYLALGRYAESEADIETGQSLRPKSSKLKDTKAWYLDTVAPVEPIVEIDERRGFFESNDDDDDPY
jgi:tetratricopeptide (TPR) repeat protein